MEPEAIETSENVIDTEQILEKERVEEANKKLVLAFYQEVFGDKEVEAMDKYIDEETYIQHNPAVADGREALKTAAKVWFTGKEKETIDVQRIGADGDIVYLHLKGKKEGKVASIMDMFRVSPISVYSV